MIKFNNTYEDRVTYPVKATVLFQDICDQVGLEAGNTNFINSEYMILGNPFTNNEDCRTVLSNIAQLAGGFAKIGRDNKVYIKTLKNITELLKVKDVHAMTVAELDLTLLNKLYGGKNDTDESLDGNNYFTDFSKNQRWGEVNSLILRLSGTEGENTVLQDDESIEKYGLTELTIEDNYFLINQQQREKVIQPLWSALKGLEYVPFKTQYYGYPYLDTGDLIYLVDSQDNGQISYVFNHTFKFNGAFNGNLETPAMTKTQTAYKNIVNAKTKFKQTERKIDKINGIIEDIIEEQSEMEQKISQHTQDIDSMTDTVKATLDFTVEVEGTNELLLQDSLDTNILKFVAKAENIENTIKFSNSLKFSSSLYPKFAGQTITVVIDKQSRANPSEEKQELYYEIKPLLKYNDTSDEFVIEYNDETQLCTVKILRYISKNNGTYTIRTVPEEEILDEDIEVKMLKGTTYLYLKEYTSWEMQAEYISNPNLNEYYASKVELMTQIAQTAEMIVLYASRKVDKTEFATYITQNADAIQIAWNQLSQYIQFEGNNGNAVLNIYDENDNKLMTLSKNGLDFYDTSNNKLGSIGLVQMNDGQGGTRDMLAFSMPVDWDNISSSNTSMAWGIFDPNDNFLPIFYLAGYSGENAGEYYGELVAEGKISADSIEVVNDLNLTQFLSTIHWDDDQYIATNMDMQGNFVTAYYSPYGHEFYSNNDLVFDIAYGSTGLYQPLWVSSNIDRGQTTGTGHNGYPLIGISANHSYFCNWDGSSLAFYVDRSYVGTLSDKRLKKEIKQVDEKFLDAINELEIKQFKIDNRNGLISFGIIAQDLIEVFKKYDINPEDYEILGKVIYNTEDNIEYYKIEYIQYLVLKQLSTDRKLKKIEQENKEKDDIIKDLIKRVEALEKGGNK